MTKDELRLAIQVRKNDIAPYRKRFNGLVFCEKKYGNLTHAELLRVFKWLKKFQESETWIKFTQICKEFKTGQDLHYRINGLTHLSEYQAYFKKRKAVRALWNVTFPEEIRNPRKSKRIRTNTERTTGSVG